MPGLSVNVILLLVSAALAFAGVAVVLKRGLAAKPNRLLAASLFLGAAACSTVASLR